MERTLERPTVINSRIKEWLKKRDANVKRLREQRNAILAERPELLYDNQGFIKELLRRQGVSA